MILLTRSLYLAALFAPFLFSHSALAKGNSPSDEDIKQSIIDESIASYPGSCACPFNSARNGSSCGRRSAWSRAGGNSPTCYKKEVTKQQVKDWRESHGG